MKYIKRTATIFAAGLTALLLLSLLFAGYFLSPMYEESRFGNTDYNFPPNAPWIQMNEGVSWGRLDSQGFNNPAVIEDPEILILGSSHMEGTYLFQDQLLGSQLQALLGPEARIYNMGISGGNFGKCVQYLEKTLEIYDTPPRLLIIEAADVALSQEQVTEILDSTMASIYSPKPRWLKPILGLPFLRQLARQKNLGLLDLLNPEIHPFSVNSPSLPAPSQEPDPIYDPLFAHLQALTEPLGVQVLIFYHPQVILSPDGQAQVFRDPNTDLFAEKCQSHGIGFLDMTEKFKTMYAQEHVVPHGFCTGRLGEGHLNANGHRAVAEEVFRWIQEKEGN